MAVVVHAVVWICLCDVSYDEMMLLMMMMVLLYGGQDEIEIESRCDRVMEELLEEGELLLVGCLRRKGWEHVFAWKLLVWRLWK